MNTKETTLSGTARSPGSPGDRIIYYALLGATLLILVLQTRSISVFPIPNATRWYSDESWVMEEAIAQLKTGIVSYPHATASTLVYTKGLLLGTPWLSAVIYGVPCLLAGTNADIVVIGRWITLILLAFAMCALVVFLQRIGTSPPMAAFAALLVASSRASFISSHCARPDVLAGLIVLLVVGYFSLLRSRNFVPSTVKWWFFFGVIITVFAWTSSVHLLTLLGPIAIWLMFSFGAFKHRSFAVSAIAGAAVTALVLAGIYVLTAQGATMFGSKSHGLQFDYIIQETPILRPFSRSVQVANIVIRVKLFAEEAPAILVLAVLDIILYCVHLIRNGRKPFLTSTEKFVVVTTLVELFTWLYLQIASPTYTMHILPVLAFLLVVVLARGLSRLGFAERLQSGLVALAGLVMMWFSMQDADIALERGSALVDENHHAIAAMISAIKDNAPRSGIAHPFVVVETPALHEIQDDGSIRFMTDHFSGFRLSEDSLIRVMQNAGANYAILYNTDHYPKDRYLKDDFFKSVIANGTLIEKSTGQFFDMHYSYFDTSWSSADTLLLYRVREQ